jgi:hypothetical protein
MAYACAADDCYEWAEVNQFCEKHARNPTPGPQWTPWIYQDQLVLLNPRRNTALKLLPNGQWEPIVGYDVPRNGQAVAPPLWQEWEYNGRRFMIDAGGFNCIEVGHGHWGFGIACVIQREGMPIERPEPLPPNATALFLKPGRFPPRTRFFVENGVPIAVFHTSNGHVFACAYDQAEPRWHQLPGFRARTTEISEAQFGHLVRQGIIESANPNVPDVSKGTDPAPGDR